MFTCVYASPNGDTRHKLWDSLKTMASDMTSPWMLTGDFNEIAYAYEKK